MNTLYVVSGVSGAGKSSIMKQLMSNELISVTTRKPRQGEIEGRDYYFVSDDRYHELMELGELAEWTDYSGHGYYYGITYEELETKLKKGDAFVISDYNGMVQFKDAYPNVVTIFIEVSKEDAEKHLKSRGENDEFIKNRLSTYEDEMSNKVHYDCVVQNKHGDMKGTLNKIRDIVSTSPRIYLSGQMSGVSEFNFPEFNRVAKLLRDKGYDVFNPAEMGVIEGWQWEDYMKVDIAELIKCDCVAVLDGWENSKGASLEVYIARQLKIPVAEYYEFL